MQIQNTRLPFLIRITVGQETEGIHMDAYLESFIEDMVNNLEYRSGIFKKTWDFATATLFMVVMSPFAAWGILNLR